MYYDVEAKILHNPRHYLTGEYENWEAHKGKYRVNDQAIWFSGTSQVPHKATRGVQLEVPEHPFIGVCR